MKKANWVPKKKRPYKTHLFAGLLGGFLLSMLVEDKVQKLIIIYAVAGLAFVAGEYMIKRKQK